MTDIVEEDKITVSKVCQDFRVREDGVLASRLQEEEFQKHYCRNKSERKTVRGDVRVAKQTYLEEVKTAQLLPDHELKEISMEETDKWLARDLQEKLHDEERKEIERQKKLALKDARVAKNMQVREKEKYDREWQRRREDEMLGRERQEREQREIEKEEVDEQTALEMRDARIARELQERERQEYERQRERYKRERERERHRYEREHRREQQRERMNDHEIDRQKELEMRDAQIARELQEREKQKFDREWQRRREQEILQEQELRHYQRSTSAPHDSRRSRTEPIAINGHGDSHHQNRPGSGKDRRENRRSTSSNSSGGSIEDGRPREYRSSPREGRITNRNDQSPPRERRPQGERSPPRDVQRPQREGHGSPREQRSPPRYGRDQRKDQSPPRDVQRPPREDRGPPRDQRSPPRERRSQREERIPTREALMKDEQRHQKQEWPSNREEGSDDDVESAAVGLPIANNGGGRLEHDRIIMADGTAIHLFEDEDDKQKAIAEEKQKALERERQKALEREKQKALDKERQKALELEKVKKDEEYAKMLQDQERRIVEAERMAAEDKRLALEEQDRELARQLQRQEYQRMQQEKKERQMRRANSIPSDRLSVNLEDPRRLPSYDEAIHRRQLPDLLPGNDPPATTRYSYVSTTSSGAHGSSIERDTNADIEREKYAAQEHDRSNQALLRSRGPEGTEYLVMAIGDKGPFSQPVVQDARSSSLDREARYLHKEQEYSSNDRHPAKGETLPSTDQANRPSYPIITDFESPQQQTKGQLDPEQEIWQAREPRQSPPSSLERHNDNKEHTQLSARSSYASSGGNSYDRRSQTSEHTHEDVWERFDDEDEFYNATGRSSRQMFRSQTVASGHPTNHDSERHMAYNVVENIDPTFRRQRKHSEDDQKESSTEERARVMHLIKPQRRRSAEKKKSKEKKK